MPMFSRVSTINLTMLLCFVFSHAHSQKLEWHTIAPQTDASFRALSVVDDSIAWVAGTAGTIGVTKNGGRDWSFSQVKSFEARDFRSLYAFDDMTAVIANAGAPANILHTSDGGKNWKVVYTNTDTAAFFDGIDFWNDKDGLIYGDPIGGKMLLLQTRDGGLTWNELAPKARPLLQEGEASFAASGTNIRCLGNQSVVIATGGRTSRLWISQDRGTRWKPVSIQIIQGQSSTGIFSFSGFYGDNGVVVGGDYLRDTLKVKHAFYTRDAGKSWMEPVAPTRGYRECVEWLNANTLVATGPGGTDISSDGGVTWVPESDDRFFHVVRKARNGKLIIIAGGKGKISMLKMTR